MKLTYRAFGTAHEALAHVHQVCMLAGIACSVLACGGLLIPAEDKPPVYVLPAQHFASLLWGVVFICSEASECNYLEYILGNRAHPRYGIFDLLFRRYREDHPKRHQFTNGLNSSQFIDTGFEKLGKASRGQYPGVGVWGKWAEDAYVRGWVVQYARTFPNLGWLEGSVVRPLGSPVNAAASDIFVDTREALAEIPRQYRDSHRNCIDRAESWWRMVSEASDAELQDGTVRDWARAWHLWQVAPFALVADPAPARAEASESEAASEVESEPVAARSVDAGDRSAAATRTGVEVPPGSLNVRARIVGDRNPGIMALLEEVARDYPE